MRLGREPIADPAITAAVAAATAVVVVTAAAVVVVTAVVEAVIATAVVAAAAVVVAVATIANRAGSRSKAKVKSKKAKVKQCIGTCCDFLPFCFYEPTKLSFLLLPFYFLLFTSSPPE
jgi:hypothetical protein